MADLHNTHQTSCGVAPQAHRRVDLGDKIQSQLVINKPQNASKDFKIHIN